MPNRAFLLLLLATASLGNARSDRAPQVDVSGAAPAAVPADVGARGCGLAPIDLAAMRRYGYDAPWTASNWNNAGSTIPWRYDHVARVGTNAVLRLDATGAPQLQAVGGTPARTEGRWEVDVTMPRGLREGVVVAPLWLYDNASKDEIDFEFVAARALTVSLHSWPGGVHKSRTIPVIPDVDFSGRRLCLGIDVRPAERRIDMLVNGRVIYSWHRDALDLWVTKPMRPYIEMWTADPANAGLSAWTGRFAGFAPGEAMTMAVHGYRYTPPAGVSGPSAR